MSLLLLLNPKRFAPPDVAKGVEFLKKRHKHEPSEEALTEEEKEPVVEEALEAVKEVENLDNGYSTYLMELVEQFKALQKEAELNALALETERLRESIFQALEAEKQELMYRLAKQIIEIQEEEEFLLHVIIDA